MSALRKPATRGNDHSFLAGHPAPGVRADRLEKGAPDPAETSRPLTGTILTRTKQVAPLLFAQLKTLLSSLHIP